MMKQAFAFLAMTLSPACVYGVDGVVLINQATVNAAGGFPYRITQPGSYKLSGNLTLPTVNTTGIDILSDNVTLDLNGFTIAGPLPCFACLPGSGDGVHTSVRNHITVRNGSIVGVGHAAVSLAVGPEPNNDPVIGAHSYLVEDLHVDHSFSGILFPEGAIVRHCTVTNSFHWGIRGTTGVIESNVINDNREAGILLSSGTIVGNIALRNGQNIVMDGATLAHNYCSASGFACPDTR